MPRVCLHGYEHSVYSWIARLALAEKRVSWNWIEIDPFSPDAPTAYRALHPFFRVPTLEHGPIRIYETTAITRYIDEAFDGPRLQPESAASRATMNQIISVVDSYCYWPFVRQVFSQGWFRAATGRAGDSSELAAGLAAAPQALDALEALAGSGPFLVGDRLSLADVHLTPMLAYFTKVEAARDLLSERPRLSANLAHMVKRTAYLETNPHSIR